jgi:ribosomal protein L11 methyltransferase
MTTGAERPPRFVARPFGNRLWLAPAEDPRCLWAHGDQLHMGLAFGTGEHSTTSLCLDWLARTRARRDVLDHWLRLRSPRDRGARAPSARRAWAIDNDPQAITATHDNARLNGCGRDLFVGAPAELPPITVDVVLANILAAPLVSLAGTFARCSSPGGKVAQRAARSPRSRGGRPAAARFRAPRALVTRRPGRLDGVRRKGANGFENRYLPARGATTPMLFALPGL